MWSDNDIDNAFRRLDPAEPEPMPFPLDAWLKLEAGLDQAVIDRAVRRRLWQFFAAEVAAVALVGLGWSLWPNADAASAGSKAHTVASATLPASKAADTKRLLGQRASSTNTPAAPVARPETANLMPALPRPTTTPSDASLATASATDAAAVSAALPVHGIIGGGRHMPLAVAVVPSTRFHSAKSQTVALSGKAVAELASRVSEDSESALPARPAGRNAKAHALAGTSEIATSSTNAKTVTRSTSSIGTAATGTVAGSRMAAPSRATSEAAIAGAASPNGGSYEAASATNESAAAARTDHAVATSPDGNTATTATRPADTNLAPAAAAEVALAQPALAPLPTQLAHAEVAPAPLPAVVRQPSFYVGLVAAPDVSTVRFANVQAPHLNLGLTLEYRLGQRWRLATGVQRSVKEYYAHRSDYDWTDYPRAQTRDFSWVEGQCTVIDIPLNLRYDAVVQGHARWFGTAGLSSFFMHRENYNYDYLENGTYKTWDIPGLVNANQHLFSILNLSAGYEYGLGTHWRLQAEPYVKVPLAGVGAGKVKLLSAGVYFGLKYGF